MTLLSVPGKHPSARLVILFFCAVMVALAAHTARASVAPTPPTNLVTKAFEGGRIAISWLDRSENEQGFRVERSTDGESFEPIAALGARSGTGQLLTYQDTSAEQDTRYWYRVQAWNGDSTACSELVPALAPSTPLTPSALTTTPLLGGRIQLTWTDRSSNETGFLIERSRDGAAFQGVTSTAAVAGVGSTRSYVNAGLIPGSRYRYRVFAFNLFRSASSNLADSLAWGASPLPDWPRRTQNGLVPWGPGITPEAGTANHIASAGQTSAETMILSHFAGTLRQCGMAKRLRFHVESLAGLTAFYVKVWAPTAPLSGSYTLRSTTANLRPYLSVGMNDLTFGALDPTLPDLLVEEGDRIGVRLEWSGGATAPNLHALPGLPGTYTCYVLNQASKSGTFAWSSQLKLTGLAFPVEFYGAAPNVAGIGDSFISGNGGQTGDPAHGSYLETGSAENIQNSWLWQQSRLFGGSQICPNQNLGRSGERSDQVADRIADLIQVHPAWAVIQMGTNDLAQNRTFEVYDASWGRVLDACLADGIVPVACFIPPWRASSDDTLGGTTFRMTARDEWNASLRVKRASYGVDAQGRPRVVVVDLDPYLGQYRPGGPAGNRWDPIPSLTADGLHYLRAGKELQALAVANALRRDGYASF